MRRIQIIQFLLISFSLILFSCTKQAVPGEEGNQESEVTPVSDTAKVSIATSFVFGEEPIKSKAGSTDLYVVQVLQMIPTGDVGNQYVVYQNYAWGVFDDISLVTLKLFKKAQYSLVVAYFPDGKNTLYHNADGTYGNPCCSIYGNTPKLNDVLYSTNSLDGPSTGNCNVALSAGDAQDQNTSSPLQRDNSWSNVERYQGVIQRFTPADQMKLTVKLYYQMYGFKITVDDFTKGHIELRGMGTDGHVYKIYPSQTSSTTEYSFIIETANMPIPGYGNIMSMTDEELEAMTIEQSNYGFDQVHISYIDEENDQINLYSNFNFKYTRNTRYNLRFSLSDAMANGGIGVDVIKEETMTDAEFPL